MFLDHHNLFSCYNFVRISEEENLQFSKILNNKFPYLVIFCIPTIILKSFYTRISGVLEISFTFKLNKNSFSVIAVTNIYKFESLILLKLS